MVKNEGESARLAGFASAMLSNVDIYVNETEMSKAKEIVHNIRESR